MRAGIACLLLLTSVTVSRAQQPARTPGPLPDSVRTALAAYRTARAASDSCWLFPEVLPDSSPRSVSQHRRDPASGKVCWTGLPPDLRQPIAYVVDGQLVCPSLRPSEWGAEMRAIRPGEILRIEVSRDSSLLSRVRCAVPASGLIWLTTNRPAADSAH